MYEIHVADGLDDRWSESFDGMQVRHEPDDGNTVISGRVRDQAALHGLLARARDLGLTLISVTRIDQEATE